MPSTFNLQSFKLKECVIPPQKDGISCGVILMMAIYQIYIQGKHVKSFYNERNHTSFRKLLFNTIYSVIELLYKHLEEKKSDKPDSIISEDIKSNSPSISISSANLQIVKDSNAPNIGPETMSSQIVQDSNAHQQANPFDSNSDDESIYDSDSEDIKTHTGKSVPQEEPVDGLNDTSDDETTLEKLGATAQKPFRIRQTARRSTGGKAPPIPAAGRSGRDAFERESRNLKIVSAPRPEEATTGHYSIETDLTDTLDQIENEDDLEKIKEIKQETFDHYATKYKALFQCKYILHKVQFKQGVQLSNRTQMALKKQNTNYKKYEDMIESHHYYVSIYDKYGKPESFNVTFFELESAYANQFLKSVKSIIDKKNNINNNSDVEDLQKMYNHLTKNDSYHYVNKWTPITKLAKPIWEKKLEKDKLEIRSMFGIPIKFKYEEFTKEGKKGTKLGYSYKVWFTFLGMDENNDDFLSGSKGKNTWFEHLDKNTLKEYGPEYENLIKNANTEPHRAITIRHEATSKTHVKLNDSTAHDKKEKKTPAMTYYQGKKSKCLTYSLAGAISYLLRSKVIDSFHDQAHILDKLMKIKQQDKDIIAQVNKIMSFKSMFQCRKMNKKKRKRGVRTPLTDILCETLVKNSIYVCSLQTTIGDNSHTVSIVNDWIFDPNYRRAIKFGRDGLDKCCKYNENCGKYKTCKDIWIFAPSEKILKENCRS